MKKTKNDDRTGRIVSVRLARISTPNQVTRMFLRAFIGYRTLRNPTARFQKSDTYVRIIFLHILVGKAEGMQICLEKTRNN